VDYVKSFLSDVSGANPARALHGSFAGTVNVSAYNKAVDGSVTINLTVIMADNLTATSGTRYPPSFGGYELGNEAAVYPTENPYGPKGQFRTIQTKYEMKIQITFPGPMKTENPNTTKLDNTVVGSGTGF